MARPRFKKGQTVYIRYHHAPMLSGLMEDPDGPLVFVEMRPAASKWAPAMCRLRPPSGTFVNGATTVDVASNMVVVIPRAEQVAEEQEKLAATGGSR